MTSALRLYGAVVLLALAAAVAPLASRAGTGRQRRAGDGVLPHGRRRPGSRRDPPGFDRAQLPALDQRLVAFFRARLLP